MHATASVVTSDDPSATDRIASYARDSSEWLVAVRMVSEGVDVPRLAVGVYATTTSTNLFFAQASGSVLTLTYEEVAADLSGTLRRTLDHIGVTPPADALHALPTMRRRTPARLFSTAV